MARFENRELVVCETFDEFAEKVDKIDFDTEDIVGLVTSLANVFYWLNVESIWGPLGFTWKVTDDYGVFNTTTVPFTIIPKLPDGERIKQLNNTFNSVSSDYIELRKSNWENLYSLTNLCPSGKTMRADLTGARITNVSNLTSGWDSYLYLKADFSNVSGNTSYHNTYSPYNQTCRMELDDDNKGMLNIHLDRGWAGIQGIWHWKGSGTWKTEYAFTGLSASPNCNSPHIYSENGMYELKNMDSLNGKSEIVMEESYGWNNLPTTLDGITLKDITIDTELNGVVCLSHVLPYALNNRWHHCKAIKFKGDVESIDWINPFFVLNGEWPDYPSDLVALADNNEKLAFKFMPQLTIFRGCSCPYTIDCTNIKNLSIFENIRTVAYNAEDYELVNVGNFTYMDNWLPKLENTHKFETVNINSPNSVLVKVPSLEAINFCANAMIYVPEGEKITVTNGIQSFAVDSTEQVALKVVADDSVKIYAHLPMAKYSSMYRAKEVTENFNFWEMDDSVTDEVLRASTVNIAYPCNYVDTIKNIYSPIIFSNGESWTFIEVPKKALIHSRVFIYGGGWNATDTNYDDIELAMTNIRKFIDATQVNDTGKSFSITLRTVYYSQLTDDEKSHIINDLGYTLVEQK